MTDITDNSENYNHEGEREHSHRHHHRHRHKYRTRERVRIKSTTSTVKRKAKKYFTYFLWTVLIALFFVSMVLLVKELNNAGIIKDRRNGDNIFFHQQTTSSSQLNT